MELGRGSNSYQKPMKLNSNKERKKKCFPSFRNPFLTFCQDKKNTNLHKHKYNSLSCNDNNKTKNQEHIS